MNQEELFLEETIEEDRPMEIPRDKRRVYSDKKDPTIRELIEQWQDGDLILDPEF